MSAPIEVPILILKKDQVLLTIRSRDFSFVLEEKFAAIFSLLERYRIKVNLVHNSAVNLSLCVDNSWHIDEAIQALRNEEFDVMKVENMELLTIRGYNGDLMERYASGPEVFLLQRTQSTARIVRKTGSPTSKKDAKIKEEKWGRCWTNTRKTLENRIRRSYDSLSFGTKASLNMSEGWERSLTVSCLNDGGMGSMKLYMSLPPKEIISTILSVSALLRILME